MTELTCDRVTTDQDGQRVVTTEDGEQAPVVGILSAETTPADFRRFEKLARQWHARRRHNGREAD